MSNIPIFVEVFTPDGEKCRVNVAAIDTITPSTTYANRVHITLDSGKTLTVRGTVDDIPRQMEEYMQRYIEAARGRDE